MIPHGYLAHHGILGQKWGVRRYQNADGSLTAAGKRRIDSMSPDKLRSEIDKDIRKARSMNKSARTLADGIGENSKKAEYDYIHARDQYEKESKKKARKIEDDYWGGKIDSDAWNNKTSKVYNDSTSKGIKEGIVKFAYVYDGKKIVSKLNKEYENTWGSKITLAYLKDLGYSDDASKYINKKILESKAKDFYDPNTMKTYEEWVRNKK